jgi:hypothetical protein
LGWPERFVIFSAVHRITRVLALIVLSVGTGLLATRALAVIERRRCVGALGRWEPQSELCVLPPDAGYSPLVDSAGERLLVALAAAVVTLLLWGAYLRLRRRLSA